MHLERQYGAAEMGDAAIFPVSAQQGGRPRFRAAERGYAMAALLAMLAVMSILLTAALPVWQHEMRREKEAELVFRGEQYVRAIYLFQRRYPGTYPPNLDVLVEQKFLRRQYTDPITGEDFQPLRVGQIAAAPQGRAGQQGQGSLPDRPRPPASPSGSGLAQGATTPLGGIIGVTSKSTEDSIRVYQGRTKYNQWPFVYAGAAQRPGAPGQPGRPRPGQPGSRPNPQMPGPRPSGTGTTIR